jgi:hypothetical protein
MSIFQHETRQNTLYSYFNVENNIKHVIKMSSKLALKNKSKAIAAKGCGSL